MINLTDNGSITPDKKPVDGKPVIDDNDKNANNVMKSSAKVNKYHVKSSNNRYKVHNKYRQSRLNNKFRYNKYRPVNNRPRPVISKQAYRLFIRLYAEYLVGNLSYADFIVLLEKEGVDPTIMYFNEDGTLSIDYDDVNDIPDKITVTSNVENIPDSSDNIDLSNPDNHESPVIDSGDVHVKSSYGESNNKEVSSSSNSVSVDSASVASSSDE